MRKIVKHILITLALVLIFVGVPTLWGINKYSDLVAEQETVDAKWAQVEHIYQQRMHYIPGLLLLMHKVAPDECEELADLVESCTNCCLLDYATATTEELESYDYLQREVASSLHQLLAVTPASPALNDSLTIMRSQIEEHERRIDHALFEFNEEAKHYNAHIHKFPAMVVARAFNMERRPYFEAEDSAAEAPEVEF